MSSRRLEFHEVEQKALSQKEDKWRDGIKGLISIAKDKGNENSNDALARLRQLAIENNEKGNEAINALAEIAKTNDKAFDILKGLTWDKYGQNGAIKNLSELAKEKNEALQYKVISALAIPAERNDVAFDALITLSKSEFILTRVKVAEAFSSLIEKGCEKGIEHLMRLGKDRTPSVREEANELIGNLIINRWIDLEKFKECFLKPEMEEVFRNDALHGLAIAATKKNEALEMLKDFMLNDRKLLIQNAAAKAIGEASKENPLAFDFLKNLALNKEEKEDNRLNAIKGLKIAIASKPKEVIDVAKNLKEEELILIKKSMAEMLAPVEEEYVTEALESLTTLARDLHPIVSVSGINSLVQIINRYPEDERAIYAFKSLFTRTEEETIKLNAIASLPYLNLTPEIYNIIEISAHDRYVLVRKSFAKVLAEISKTYPRAKKTLEILAKDNFEEVKKTAEECIASLRKPRITESYGITGLQPKLTMYDQIKLHLLHYYNYYKDIITCEVKKTARGGILHKAKPKKNNLFRVKALKSRGIADATFVLPKNIVDAVDAKKHRDNFCRTEGRPIYCYLTGEGYKKAIEIEKRIKNELVDVIRGDKIEKKRLEEVYNEINNLVREKYKSDTDKIASESKSYMWIIKQIVKRKLNIEKIERLIL